MKAAMALEKAAEGESSAQGGIGMGFGLMIPGLLAGLQTGSETIQIQNANKNFCPIAGTRSSSFGSVVSAEKT